MALLRGLSSRGLDVAPMKCGPDFIDPRFHEACVSGPSFNLDRYFLSEEGLIKRYEARIYRRRLPFRKGKAFQKFYRVCMGEKGIY